MTDGYILQHPDFGLGNFINITPTIAWMHQTQRRRIPVYFTADYVRQCFLDWPAIEILDRQPDTGPLFGSNLVNPENDMPDYQYVFERITGQKWHPGWHTYIDKPALTKEETVRFDAPYILIICGSGSDSKEYFAKKNPGEQAYRDAIMLMRRIKYTFGIYAVGSEADAVRSPWMKDMADECFFGDIRQALKLIGHHGCRMVISNDCGLAHATGAMNQPLIMIWKDTPNERCKNAGANTEYWHY